MKNNTNIPKDSNTKTFNTCFDNIDLNFACLKSRNLKNGPTFSFFYEYAHDRSVLSLSLDESGTYMATASSDHSLRIHNLKNLSTVKELYHKKCGHYDWVSEVFFTKRNEVLSGGLDGKICLWNTTQCCKFPKINKIMNCSEYLEQEKKVREINFKASNNTIKCKEMWAHHSTISDMKFDKEKEKCITSSYDKTLKLFDIKKFSELATYKGNHIHPITKFLWLQNKIISADKSGTLCVFDVETFQEVLSAKNTHCGNIGALNYFYMYKSKNSNLINQTSTHKNKTSGSNFSLTNPPMDDSNLEKSSSNNSSSIKNKYDNDNNKRNNMNNRNNLITANVNIINSDNLFGQGHNYLNLNNERIPLIITGGTNDGILKIRDFRIFHKYISYKKIHTASINSIITYNIKNKTYIISCSADGCCYQYEIYSICSSNLNNYLKKICVNEPILSARYIGNHLVLVGSSFGNLFLLNFSDCSENNLTQQYNLTRINEIQDNFDNSVEKKNYNNIHDKTDRDILWAFGVCKKGGVNCIECTFIYDSTVKNTNELEIYNIVTAGDDGTPCLLYIPNSFV
ncbi:WD repeat-containing protein [Plasmodium brasilianum]|uniref:WD repeat-containing protein, putative n=2 Tax=Plasmodium (Plasmodium) TaxID=418103 RepID=A0A1A8W0K8_PLAMA|nr:WD repeat-containing protein, putative [Plasmodium malariae]KAI4838335.1 WD repeat-containing protein [Plasmodium brasilianum]SBS85477.1 WD repeat-containing protein, putative [Plasmodium malariae]SCN12733.1 WD repeat-containing protein, putative [Plasmodium malariae]